MYDLYELKDFYDQSAELIINHDDANSPTYVRTSQGLFIANPIP